MARSLKIISNAKTHVGNKRAINQDAFLAQPELGIWIVADGMGGHHNGEYASGLVTQPLTIPASVVGFDATVDFLKLWIRQNNTELYYYAKRLGESVRCGTTLVCIVLRGNKVAVLWVGDSRVYRYSLEQKKMTQITKDHTVFNQMFDKGLVDDFHPMAEQYKGALARVVGGEADVEVDEVRFVLNSDERFLLCTDGVTKELTDQEIENILAQNQTPGVTCGIVIDESLKNIGRDNMTACVVDVSFV